MGSIHPTGNFSSFGLGKQNGINKLQKSIQRLSTGKKRPTAEEGVGFNNLAHRLKTQVMRSKSIQTTIRNAIGYSQTQDETLVLAEKALQKMGSLIAAATDPLKTDLDRSVIDVEVQKIESEIEHLKVLKYNGLDLFSSESIDFVPNNDSPLYSLGDHSGGPHSTYWDPSGLISFGEGEIPHQDPINYTLGTGDGWIEAGAPYLDPNVTITYSFHSSIEGDPLIGISTADSKAAIVESLALWSTEANGNLNFQEVADSGPAPSDSPNYDPTGLPIMRFGAHYIDGDGAGVLAHAFYPTANSGLAGDTHYDTAQTWDINLFLETSVHEVGHALGLGHTSNPGIMEPIIQNRYTGGLGTAFLLQDDIDGIQTLYAGGEVLTEGSDSIYTLTSSSFENFDLSSIDTTSLSNAQFSMQSLQDLHTGLQKMKVIVGSNLRSLDKILTVHSKAGLSLKESQSAIEDIDIGQAIADFTANQIAANAELSITAQALQISSEITKSLIT
jgi:flagellin-like hook-associated protein FlgL